MSSGEGEVGALLELRGVSRVYGGEPPVAALEDVTLGIHEGEFVSVVGTSGSGKSTLLNLVTLLDRPTSGVYRLAGRDVGTMGERERSAARAAFGLVFQSFHLMPRRTALANVEVGLVYSRVARRERRKRGLAALERVGLAHRVDHVASKLSGGEQQRVAIARALASGARVLVADEPTGNLDSANSQSIVELLRALNEGGVTVLLVTHDASVAGAADRVVELADGRIVRDSGQSHPPAPGSPVAESKVGARLSDLGREAWRSVRSYGRRSVALTGAVAVAVGLVIATLGLSQTASAQVSEHFDATRNKQVTVGVADAGSPETTTYRAGLPDDAEARILQLAGVVDAAILYAGDQANIAHQPGDKGRNVLLLGGSQALLEVIGAEVDWAQGHDGELGSRELVLGDIAAGALEIGTVDARPSVLVSGVPFTVVGIMTNTRREVDALTGAVVRGEELPDLVRGFSMDVLINTVPGAAQQVARQAPVALDPVAPERFFADAPPDPQGLRAEIEGDVASALVAVSAVAILAALVGIANTASSSVAERTSEFGLRRALGARPRHVFLQVSVEVLFTGLLGGLAGLYLGMSSVLAMTIANGWQPVMDLRVVPVAIGAGALTGLVGGFAASLRASRIQPIDALRR